MESALEFKVGRQTATVGPGANESANADVVHHRLARPKKSGYRIRSPIIQRSIHGSNSERPTRLSPGKKLKSSLQTGYKKSKTCSRRRSPGLLGLLHRQKRLSSWTRYDLTSLHAAPVDLRSRH